MQKITYATLAASTRHFEDFYEAHAHIESLLGDYDTPDLVQPLLDMLHVQGDYIYQLYTLEAMIYGPFDDKYGPAPFYDMVDNMALDFINIVEDYAYSDSGDYFISASDYRHLGDRLREFTIRLNKTVGTEYQPEDIKKACDDIAEALDSRFLKPNWREIIKQAAEDLEDLETDLKENDPECYIREINTALRSVAGDLIRIANLDPKNIKYKGGRAGMEERTQGYITRLCRLAGVIDRSSLDNAEIRRLAHLANELWSDIERDWDIDIDWELYGSIQPEWSKRQIFEEIYD